MSMFGPEFEQIWPKAGAALKLSEFGKTLLKQCENVKKPDVKEVDINEFILKSSSFPLEFGTNTCRVMSQPKDRYPQIQKQIASAYPVIHERVVKLYLDFLEHKCKYGSPMEKELYQNLSLLDFVQRLLTKRCAAFVGPLDAYLLLTGESGYGIDYAAVGTSSEKEPLILKNVLSYDEIKLSVFLSVSSFSELINDGTRRNRGIAATDLSKIEREAVVIDIVGARFQKPGLMEYQDVIIDLQNNVGNKGRVPNERRSVWSKLCHLPNEDTKTFKKYRKLWEEFYEDSDHHYISHPSCRFFRLLNPTTKAFFDAVRMKKRNTISIDTLLVEAQSRASALGKQAFVHIVGIGLGVWRVADQQIPIFLETFMQRVKELLKYLNNIGVLFFSWMGVEECGELKNNGWLNSDSHPRGGIRTFVSKRNPGAKLQGEEFEDMLLIISYAGDGNALPGNEFWCHHLDNSSDSATASSTLITELHNPFINTNWVCGENLHIASMDKGIMHISEFAAQCFSKDMK